MRYTKILLLFLLLLPINSTASSVFTTPPDSTVQDTCCGKWYTKQQRVRCNECLINEDKKDQKIKEQEQYINDSKQDYIEAKAIINTQQAENDQLRSEIENEKRKTKWLLVGVISLGIVALILAII